MSISFDDFSGDLKEWSDFRAYINCHSERPHVCLFRRFGNSHSIIEPEEVGGHPPQRTLRPLTTRRSGQFHDVLRLRGDTRCTKTANLRLTGARYKYIVLIYGERSSQSNRR